MNALGRLVAVGGCVALLLSGVVSFFFSSRGRHTSCYRDWSSDVCSSDLTADDHVLALLPVCGRGHFVFCGELNGIEGAQDFVEVAPRGHRVAKLKPYLLVGTNE